MRCCASAPECCTPMTEHAPGCCTTMTKHKRGRRLEASPFFNTPSVTRADSRFNAPAVTRAKKLFTSTLALHLRAFEALSSVTGNLNAISVTRTDSRFNASSVTRAKTSHLVWCCMPEANTAFCSKLRQLMAGYPSLSKGYSGGIPRVFQGIPGVLQGIPGYSDEAILRDLCFCRLPRLVRCIILI